jgi:hypothetical protein
VPTARTLALLTLVTQKNLIGLGYNTGVVKLAYAFPGFCLINIIWGTKLTLAITFSPMSDFLLLIYLKALVL